MLCRTIAAQYRSRQQASQRLANVTSLAGWLRGTTTPRWRLTVVRPENAMDVRTTAERTPTPLTCCDGPEPPAVGLLASRPVDGSTTPSRRARSDWAWGCRRGGPHEGPGRSTNPEGMRRKAEDREAGRVVRCPRRHGEKSSLSPVSIVDVPARPQLRRRLGPLQGAVQHDDLLQHLHASMAAHLGGMDAG
jgi:hypothetical protein